MKPASNREAPASWDVLLIEAVNTPGTISAAYHAFHNYSVGNQILAFWQCTTRGIQPGPLGTFNAWKERDRMVRKGEKAIVLCQPKTSKRTAEDEETGEETTSVSVFFSYRAAWFVVSQTEGEDATAPVLPEWTPDRALAALNVSCAPFSIFDGNTQGYAFNRSIAINPVAANPLKTTAHELAHILLGHTDSAQMDGANLPRNPQGG